MLSPDEQQIALERHDPGTGVVDIWLLDQSGVSSRTTTSNRWAGAPHWSPDGDRLLYTTFSDRLHVRTIRGGETEEIAISGNLNRWPTDWSPNFVVLTEPAETLDIVVLPVQGERTIVPYLRTQFNETAGKLSPGGRWLAYVSDESGTNEVYVQSFPLSGNKLRISPSGGNYPQWRKDGRELYYVAPDGTLMAVGLTTAVNAPNVSLPIMLFQTSLVGRSNLRSYYWPNSSGQRFLISAWVDDPSPQAITVAMNWPEGLRP